MREESQVTSHLLADEMGARSLADAATGLIDAGGPVVVLLLGMSILAFAIVLLKLWQFHVVRLGDKRTPREAVALHRAGRSREALELLGRSRNPTAYLLGLAIRGHQGADLSESKIREEVTRVGADLLEELRGYFRPLEVIASLAPLLGLFGTVLGMIAAFQALEAAGNRVDPATLSGGIWEALLTTAVGLAVAIPTVVALNWLERRVERVSMEMQSLVTQVFTGSLEPMPLSRLESDDEQPIGVRHAPVPAGE